MNFKIRRALICAVVVPAFFAAGCRATGGGDQLEGVVSITVSGGEIISGRMLPVVGSVLEADISALNGDGRCSYEWYKDNQKISGAEEKTYTVDVKDRKAGIIEVRVSRDGFNGTQSGLLSGPFSGGGPLGEATAVALNDEDYSGGIKAITYNKNIKTWALSLIGVKVYLSTDNGASWHKATESGQMMVTGEDGEQHDEWHTLLTTVNGKFFVSSTPHYGAPAYTVVSDDGISWTELNVAGSAFGFDAIMFDGLKYRGLRSSKTGISDDGLTWTLQDPTDTYWGSYYPGSELRGFISDGERFYIFGDLNTSEFHVKSSQDCLTWEGIGRGMIDYVAYQDGLYVCLLNGNIVYSEDVGSFDAQTNEEITAAWNFAFPTMEELVASEGAAGFNGNVVVYSPESERWLAVGDGGAAAESYDGKEWRPYQTGTEKNLISAVFGGGRWMVGTDEGEILYFDDPMYIGD